jgi:hypothetical protein
MEVKIFGDVLLTGVEVVSTRGNMTKNSGFELGWVWYSREVVL